MASPSDTSAESSESYDNWYLVGCIVTVVCAWEGLKTLVPRGTRKDSVPSSETRVGSEETNILQPIKQVVPIRTQTQEVVSPQLEALLHTRTKQAQTIRALQGRIMISKPYETGDLLQTQLVISICVLEEQCGMQVNFAVAIGQKGEL